MDFIREINAFEQWLETNYLPPLSQLLWYKLFMLNNRAGWAEWITVDNRRLMLLIQAGSENTFLRARDKLIEADLIIFRKGKKGSPNKYSLRSLVKYTSNIEVQPEVNTEVETEVNTEVQPDDINKLKENESSKGSGAPPPPPPPADSEGEKVKHKRGQYGWVKLTNAEYARLIKDHGEAAALHYINYVDESAQQTGNKNKWKDWNLTVRKAIRQQWGGPPPDAAAAGAGARSEMERLYGRGTTSA